jgi:hypothetical protein
MEDELNVYTSQVYIHFQAANVLNIVLDKKNISVFNF